MSAAACCTHAALCAQINTQLGASRPCGLGLLVVGVDDTGPCLYETCPSGDFWQCKAMAFGARSQAAKTYLERELDVLMAASADALIKHALLALQVWLLVFVCHLRCVGVMCLWCL